METGWSRRGGGVGPGCPRRLGPVQRCDGGSPSFAKRPVAGKQARQFFVVEALQERYQALTASEVDLAEDAAAGIGRVDQYDAPILAAVPPLEEATLLHAIHDPGHAGDRDVESLGEVAHGVGTVGVKDREDVEMNQAERVAMPAPEGNDELARVPGQELAEEGVDEPSTAIRGGHLGRRYVDIQCHINNLRYP